MKNLILAVALTTGLCFTLTSCDKDSRRCYKFTYEVEIANTKTEINTYEWCSINEADAKRDDLENKLGVKVSRSVVKKHKTAEDCIAANLEQ